MIDLNETQVRTLELARRVVAGTDALEFRRCDDDQGRYAWIESVLRRFEYRQLPRNLMLPGSSIWWIQLRRVAQGR